MIGGKVRTFVFIYKNKGDIQNCQSYKGIKLMCDIMKLCEKVIKHRLQCETSISKNQFDFMSDMSITKVIYLHI